MFCVFIIAMTLICILNCLLFFRWVDSEETFNYEKRHMFGLGRPIIFRPRHSGYAYPEDLPKSSPAPYIRSPYRNIYQGVRNKGDTRVYNKRFVYPATESGHRLFCEGVFDCTLKHLSIETNGSIPILFRGGVGYRYFSVIIRADPGDELSGRVRAYCAKIQTDKHV